MKQNYKIGYEDLYQDQKKRFRQDLKALAIKYLQRGFSVIPMSYKNPLIQWKEYQNRKATLSEVESWFQMDMEITGLGIVTGKISNITVIDIERDENYRRFVEKYEIPKTPKVRSGNQGVHFYFRYDPDHKLKSENLKRIGINGDIKSDGGIIVAPFSYHQNKNKYCWFVDGLEVPMANLPQKLKDKLDELCVQTELKLDFAIKNTEIDKLNEAVDIVKIISEFTKLEYSGTDRMKGICPLHKDKDPSLVVYPRTNSFYCFGCNIGGKTIEFLKHKGGLSTKRAVQLLKRLANQNKHGR